MGHCINKIALITRGIDLRKEDEKKYEIASSFIELFSSEWTDRITGQCLKSLYDSKLDEKSLLPLTSDLVKIAKYLENSIENLIEISKEKFLSLQEWQKFAGIMFIKFNCIQ